MDEIKDFVEIMYERWIRADMHYSFTVEINKRFDKFQLPFKLSSGTVIGKGYKTTESIDKILDHRMFERKIAYSEEMIMSTEMLDKKCALDYIVDALQYFISVQRGNGVDKKYAAAAREICSNQDSKIYAVVKAEISEVMKLSNEYFDIRHNEYLNKAKEKREALDDLQFIEYLYNRVYALLYLVRLKVNKADLISLGSYYKFLVKYEKEYKIRLSEDEEKVIEFVSKKLANGKRIQELQILKRILTYAHGLSKIGLFAGLSEDMREYGKNISQDQKENIVNVMTNKFPAGASKKTYSQCVFMEQEGNDYKPTKLFMQMLANDEFYGVLQELVDFGISRYERDYKNTYDQTDLVLYQKYTYEDVCRLLNWEQNEVPLNIGGYKFDKKTKTFPVFINYDKAEDISDTTKYEDHFIPGFRDRLIAISKSGRNLQSEDVQNFLKAKERGIQVELFVRKNKDDKVSKEFYYLGHMTASGNTKEFTMTNTEKTAVEIEWILDVPVREDIYEYIVNS